MRFFFFNFDSKPRIYYNNIISKKEEKKHPKPSYTETKVMIPKNSSIIKNKNKKSKTKTKTKQTKIHDEKKIK